MCTLTHRHLALEITRLPNRTQGFCEELTPSFLFFTFSFKRTPQLCIHAFIGSYIFAPLRHHNFRQKCFSSCVLSVLIRTIFSGLCFLLQSKNCPGCNCNAVFLIVMLCSNCEQNVFTYNQNHKKRNFQLISQSVSSTAFLHCMQSPCVN